MQCDTVGSGEVYAFDYVYFAAVGPVGSEEPEGGPDAADTAWPVVLISVKIWGRGCWGTDMWAISAMNSP